MSPAETSWEGEENWDLCVEKWRRWRRIRAAGIPNVRHCSTVSSDCWHIFTVPAWDSHCLKAVVVLGEGEASEWWGDGHRVNGKLRNCRHICRSCWDAEMMIQKTNKLDDNLALYSFPSTRRQIDENPVILIWLTNHLNYLPRYRSSRRWMSNLRLINWPCKRPTDTS